jgi:hypothetical protein
MINCDNLAGQSRASSARLCAAFVPIPTPPMRVQAFGWAPLTPTGQDLELEKLVKSLAAIDKNDGHLHTLTHSQCAR